MIPLCVFPARRAAADPSSARPMDSGLASYARAPE
jgi:hypothetical protein